MSATPLRGGANVLTFHNDAARTGLNSSETILTPATVASTNFSRLVTYSVDGYVYAQPLYLRNVDVPGQGLRNVVFVATEHNSVYAFDADNSDAAGGLLWQVNLGPAAVTTIVGVFTNQNFGTRYNNGAFTDIMPEVGITGTPVIDTNTGSLFVSAFTGEVAGGVTNYFHRLHALKLTDGSEQPYSPVVISASVPGVGVDSVAGRVNFNAQQHLQRSALTLAGGIVYVAFCGFADTDPYHGWVIGFNANDLTQPTNHVFNTTPNSRTAQYGSNAGEGGIWMGGNGPAVDAQTNLYFIVGNGTFNVTNNSGNTEYGDSYLKLSTTNGLQVADYFTPANQLDLAAGDNDLGAGGLLLLPDQTGPNPRVLIGAGKDGRIFMLNRDQFTTANNHFNASGGADAVLQSDTARLSHIVFTTPAYFNGRIYYGAASDSLKAFPVVNGQLAGSTLTGSARTYAFPGTTPSISANGTSNGIVWAIRRGNPAILVACNATNLVEIYTSTNAPNGRDALANGVKFAVPTVADGKVFVGGQYSFSVFGLNARLATPVINPSGGIFAYSAYVGISASAPGATIYYTLDGSAPTTNSTAYTGLFQINASTIVRARAVKSGALDSDIASADITIIYPIIDTNAPACTILTPTPGQRWSNAVFTVTGSAADDQAVASVFVNANNSGWFPATTSNGWNNWSAPVSLTPGTNTIYAYALDSSGNQSFAAATTVIYVTFETLTVNFDANAGSVSPNYHNASLPIGENFSLTATPKPGFGFGNWTDGTGNVLAIQPNLQFTMAPGLVLSANFLDATRPTVSVTNLPASGVVSNALFTLQGRCADNVGVASVYLSLNGSGWLPAALADDRSSWSAVLTLSPGTNLITVTADDAAGNYALPLTSRLVSVSSGFLTVRTNGSGSVAPNYNNVALQLGVNYALTATPKAGFAFTNWTDGNGGPLTNAPTLKFTMNSNLVFTANFVDSSKPLISLTNLPATGLVSNDYFTLRGRASDNVSVANVFYNVNNTGWNTAITTNSWTNWSGLVNLTPGSNLIRFTAMDGAGNYSVSNGVRLTYVVSAVLKINTNGVGNISPVANGALLQVGKEYTLTATPAAGFVFSNWTDAGSSVVTNRPALKFVMTSNLAFTARFVDVSKPVLTVLSPLPATIATAEFFRASGRAADNARVASVFYQLNGGNWYAANTTNHWTNWNVILDLTPGTNYFAAYAADTSGHLSATNLTRFIYQTAPASLTGLKAQVTPDGGSAYDMVFGAGLFSQNAADLKNPNGLGTYAYTRLTPNAGRLNATFTAPPQATNDPNIARQLLNLVFYAPNQARYTITNNGNTGGIIFTATPTFVPANLVNQTLVSVYQNGDADSTRFTAAQSITANLLTRVTNAPRNYGYAAYGPLTGLIKQIGTNGVSYTLATLRGTNYGTSYSERYTLAGTLTAINQASFGLASQRPSGNAPTNLFNRLALVTSTDDSFQLIFGTNSFTQLNPTNSLLIEGTGLYLYSRIGTNAGNLDLNFLSPPQTSSALFLFLAPNFAVFTNADRTAGSAVLK